MSAAASIATTSSIVQVWPSLEVHELSGGSQAERAMSVQVASAPGRMSAWAWVRRSRRVWGLPLTEIGVSMETPSRPHWAR